MRCSQSTVGSGTILGSIGICLDFSCPPKIKLPLAKINPKLEEVVLFSDNGLGTKSCQVRFKDVLGGLPREIVSKKSPLSINAPILAVVPGHWVLFAKTVCSGFTLPLPLPKKAFLS